MNTLKLGMALVLTLSATACVSQGRYDRAVADTETTRAELGKKNAALEAMNAELETQRAEVARLETMIAEASRGAAKDRTTSLSTIDDLKKRLEELKVSHAAAESRAALFRAIAVKLQKQVDAGDLVVTVRDGRMVLQLPNDVLFDTGRTELKPAGQAALEAVASVLASMPDRHFQIAGHTDNVPIHTATFPSNWELSAARGLRVVHFLVDHKVKPENLSAAGYAETDPIASNELPDGRKHNRRTEITLQPELRDLVPVP